jgi:hypothetical protein
VLLEHRTVAQVIVERHARVIDEDVEKWDFVDSPLDLRSVWSMNRRARTT